MLEWTGRWGRYPAAAALFAFVALELAQPTARLSAHARHRDRALLVLGTCGDGGLRPRRVDARRRGVRGRVRAPLANRAVRGSGRSRRRALAVHGARRRRAHPRDARLRRGHAGVDELRRVLAHDHVENLIGDIRRGPRRIGTADRGSRDDARERRGADAPSWRRWRSRTSARSGGRRARPARDDHSSRTSSSRWCPSPPRTWSPTTSRCSSSRASSSSRSRPTRSAAVGISSGRSASRRISRSSRRRRSGTSRSGRSSSATSRVSRSRTIGR